MLKDFDPSDTNPRTKQRKRNIDAFQFVANMIGQRLGENQKLMLRLCMSVCVQRLPVKMEKVIRTTEILFRDGIAVMKLPSCPTMPWGKKFQGKELYVNNPHFLYALLVANHHSSAMRTDMDSYGPNSISEDGLFEENLAKSIVSHIRIVPTGFKFMVSNNGVIDVNPFVVDYNEKEIKSDNYKGLMNIWKEEKANALKEEKANGTGEGKVKRKYTKRKRPDVIDLSKSQEKSQDSTLSEKSNESSMDTDIDLLPIQTTEPPTKRHRNKFSEALKKKRDVSLVKEVVQLDPISPSNDRASVTNKVLDTSVPEPINTYDYDGSCGWKKNKALWDLRNDEELKSMLSNIMASNANEVRLLLQKRLELMVEENTTFDAIVDDSTGCVADDSSPDSVSTACDIPVLEERVVEKETPIKTTNKELIQFLGTEEITLITRPQLFSDERIKLDSMGHVLLSYKNESMHLNFAIIFMYNLCNQVKNTAQMCLEGCDKMAKYELSTQLKEIQTIIDSQPTKNLLPGFNLHHP